MKISDTSIQDIQLDPGKVRMRRLWKAGALLLILGGLSTYAMMNAGTAGYSVDGERLRRAVVSRDDLLRDIRVRGKIVAGNAPVLYSSVNGIVKLHVKAGDRVGKGELLLALESPELSNELKQQGAMLDRAKVDYENSKLETRRSQMQLAQTLELKEVDFKAAEREKDRAKLSFGMQVLSEMEYEKSRDTLAKAEVEFRHARQQYELNKETLSFNLRTQELEVQRQSLVVEELQRRVDELKVRAPVSGVVGNLLVTERQQVAGNTPLLTVVDLSAYEAELEVPESYADELGPGMDVEIEIGTEKLKGRLSSLSPEVENRQVKARVVFENTASTRLRQNQRLNARILLEKIPQALIVSAGPFLQSGGGHIAYRIEDDMAYKTPIKTTAGSAAYVQILDGLKEGDEIVISSLEIFKETDQVFIR